MPYNTRRKSLSLPSLGIQLPHGSRAHRPSHSKPSIVVEEQPPPTKKVKRSHSPNLTSTPTVRSQLSKNVSFVERPKSNGRAHDHTPPPSPIAGGGIKVDTNGINDGIVVCVIEQLEKTGNRPHLIKELATVLAGINDAVLSSQNPSALLSSRLAAYLRRQDWSTLSPCPLAKELIPVHPRKVFYYLTTCPRQEIPPDSSDILPLQLLNTLSTNSQGGKRIISPSISNDSIDGDNDGAEARKRAAISPSPEVDLSNPDLADDVPLDDDFNAPPTPAGSFSGRSSLNRDGTNGSISDGMNHVHNHRAASPPLEKDEKEFTQTASSMRMRGMSFDEQDIRPTTETEELAAEYTLEETEEEKAKKNQEAAATLFGEHHEIPQQMGLSIMSSPHVKPMHAQLFIEKISRREGTVDLEMKESTILSDSALWDIRPPESIELDELDDLFCGF